MMMAHAGVLAQAGAAPPLPLTDILAGWDMDPAYVTNVGGFAAGVADFTGNSRHLLMTASSKRAAVTSTGGFPSVLFDGVDDCFSVASAAAPAAAGPKTLYAVINPTGFTGSYDFLFDTDGWSPSWPVANRWAAGKLPAGQWGQFDGTSRSSGVTATTGLKRVAFEAVTGASNVRVNGAAGTPAGWVTSPSLGTLSTIGSHYGTSALFFKGHILWMGIYGAAYNAAVDAYLQWRFGV